MKTAVFRSCLALATLLIGASIYAASSLRGPMQLVAALVPHVHDLASILSGYAFTVAGFLATIATFLFTLGEKPYFRLYQKRGSFSDLMFLHALALIVLGAVFICSILLFARPALLRLTLTLTLLSIVQLFFLTMISYTLSKRSND